MICKLTPIMIALSLPSWGQTATAAPDARHQELTGLAGEWQVEMTLWHNPAEPPLQVDGSAVLSAVLDGRFLRSELDAEIQGNPFHGIGHLGFDRLKDTYVADWMDTTSTSLIHLTGNLDAKGRTIVLRGELTDPVTHLPLTARVEWYIYDPAKFTVTWFIEYRDGRELKALELHYSRPVEMTVE